MNDNDKTLLMRAAEWQLRRRGGGKRWTLGATVIAGSSIAVMSTGVAFAAWTSSVAGTGAAKAGSISFAVDATSSPSPTNTLHPGSTAGTATGDATGGDLLVTLKNTSGFTVHVTSIQQNGPISVSGAVGCTSDTGTVGTPASPGSVTTAGNSGVSLPTWTAPNSNSTVAPDSNDHLITASNALTMATTSNTACQGATFSVPVIVTVSS